MTDTNLPEKSLLSFRSFNEDEFKIIEVKPCTKEFLFHSSGKKLEKLDPKYNRKLDAYGSVHEYGVPVARKFPRPRLAVRATALTLLRLSHPIY